LRKPAYRPHLDACIQERAATTVHAGIIIARNAEIKVADPSLRAMLVEGMTDSTGGLDAQESASA
jgi:hypothetical protein